MLGPQISRVDLGAREVTSAGGGERNLVPVLHGSVGVRGRCGLVVRLDVGIGGRVWMAILAV
jgi:hypothetical protein